MFNESITAQTYLELAGVIIVAIGTDEKVILINRRGCKTLGYSKEEIIGKNWFDSFIPTSIREQLRTAFHKAIKEGIEPLKHVENPVTTRSGEERLISWENILIRDERGKVSCTLSSGEDITEHKLAEQALAVSEQRYRSLVEEAGAAICRIDLTGCFTFVNQFVTELFGYSNQELIGRHFQDYLHTEDRESLVKLFIDSVPLESQPGALEFRIMHKDGHILYLSTQPARITVDGKTVGFQVVIADLTECRIAEEVLANERNVLQIIMENTRAHLAYLDPQFNFLKVNSTYAKGSGHAVEELVGKNHFDLFPNKENQEIFERVRDTSEAVEYHDKPFVYPDQPERGVTYWDWTLTPVIGSSGKTIGLVLSLVDTTERKKLEEALRESEELYRKYFELGLLGMAIESPTGDWIEVNEKLCEIYGYPREELMKKHWKDLTHPEDLDKDLEYFRKLQRGEIDRYSLEKRYIRKDGEVITCIISIGCRRHPNREVALIFAFVMDITNQKKAEEALRGSEEKYRAIFEQAADSIVLVDVETGKMEQFNTRAHENLGYTREEFARLKISDFEVIESEEETANHIRKIVLAGADIFETRQRTKSGLIRDIQVNARAIRIGGKQYLHSVWRDITERKQAEEALKLYKDHLEELVKDRTSKLEKEIATRKQAEKEIRELAHRLAKVQDIERSAIARELHDDVGQMLTYLTMLIHKTKQTPIEANFDMLTTTTRETLQTVRSLCSRLLPPQLENLTLNDALLSLFEQYTKSTQVKVSFSRPDELPPLSAELKLAAYRIIQEALTNVARHARVNKAHVNVSSHDGYLDIMVVDKGAGFNLSQAKKSIGLTSMRERAQAVGGQFSIESTPGQGTKVTAILPLVPPSVIRDV